MSGGASPSLPPEPPGANQPYHFAENLELPGAEKFLGNCFAASKRLDMAAVRDVVDELHGRQYRVVGSAVLASCRPLYRAYQTGNRVTRQRLLEAPLVFLKSHKQAQAAPALLRPSLGDSLLSDLEVLSSAARRADRRLRQGVLRNLAEPQRQELARCLEQSLHETERLAERFHQEMGDVGSEHADRDSEARATGA